MIDRFPFHHIRRSFLLIVFLLIPDCEAVEILWEKNFNVGMPDTSVLYTDILPNPGKELVFATTRGKIAVASATGEMLWVTDGSYGVICNPPTVADLVPGNGPEVVVVNRNGVVMCLTSSGGELWRYDFPAGFEWNQTTLLPADVDGDGQFEILAGDKSGHFVCLNHLGTEEWACQIPGGFHCPPAVADLDGDGLGEIVLTSGDGNLIALKDRGEVLWKAPLGGDNISGPVVADLDRDGLLDIVVGGLDPVLHCYSDKGSLKWKSPLTEKGIDSTIAVGNLLGDENLEILCCDLGGYCYCFDSKGKELWKSQFADRIRRPPSIADFNGDGKIEILVSGYFNTFHLLSAEGKEVDRVRGLDTNGGATLVEVGGRLAAVIPGSKGTLTCLTWQGEALPRLPKVEWGNYRFDSNHSGCVPKEIEEGGATITRVDPGPLRVGRNVFRVLGHQERPLPLSIELTARSIRSDKVFKALIETASSEFVGELPYTVWGTEESDYVFTYRVERIGGTAISSGDIRKRLAPFEEETKELEDCIDRLRRLDERLMELGVELKDLSVARLHLADLREKVEIVVHGPQPPDEEGVLELARRIQRTLQEIETVRSRGERILDFSEGSTIPRLLVWSTNPWWQIRGPEEELSEYLRSKEVSLFLYKNEVESGAVNLTNLEDRPVAVRVKTSKQMGEDEDPEVKVFEVISVPTEMEDYSDDALAELNKANTIHISPGETRQIFVSVNSGEATPGKYESEMVLEPVTVKSNPVAVRITAEVAGLDIKEETPPHLCTWGYVDGSCLRDFPEEAWRDRRDHGNNAIVITSDLLPHSEYDDEGNLKTQLDFSKLQDFVKSRPGAFFLLLGYGGVLTGPQGTDRFSKLDNQAFKNWLAKVVATLKGEGIGYDRFALYPVDEPGLSPGLVDLYINYAKQARDADPRVLMYTDPVAGADMDDIQRMAEYVDVWCPNRGSFLLKDLEPRLDVMKKNAKMMWTYECQHHAKHRPPLEYYRGLAWLAELRGLTGFGFWSYCTSADDPWEYPSKSSHDYLLVYPGNGVVTSRRWEAVRDGVEDLRALWMLKDRIVSKSGDPSKKETLSQARKVVEEAVEELGRFGAEPNGTGDFETVGLNWVTPQRVDAEWKAYQKHRRRIAEMTKALAGGE